MAGQIEPSEKVIFLLVTIVFILMLSVCAPDLQTRFDLANLCQQENVGDCKEEWAYYNEGIAAQERRALKNSSPCKKGYYLYCDQWCTRTSKTSTQKSKEGICVPHQGRSW